MRKLWEHFRALPGRLLSLKDRPHAVAGGAAIGMFLGFTPLFGLKTLLSLGLAWILRCNPIAAVVAVSLHDVLTPLWPIILKMEYDIGYWLMSHPHHFPHQREQHSIHLAEMLEWTTFLDVGLPLLIGSLFFAIPAAALTYAVVLAILKKREARRAAVAAEDLRRRKDDPAKEAQSAGNPPGK